MNSLGTPPLSNDLRYIAVGDIHGASDQLERLLEQNELFADRRAVFLGDYVDVGANGKLVISALRRFAELAPDTIFLCGNHDFLLVEYYNIGDFVRYACRAGLPTIRSYVGKAFGDVHEQFRNSIPEDDLQFLRNLIPFFETSGYLFSHAGFSALDPSNRSFSTMALGSHQELFSDDAAPPEKVAVFGHYFQRNHRPWVGRNMICIDTGCGITQGPLTAVLLPEKRFVSISPNLTILHDA
jgi:serine/threonine protein phosphatase 1